MHPALRKGPLIYKKHPQFFTFLQKTLPPFHFLPTGLTVHLFPNFSADSLISHVLLPDDKVGRKSHQTRLNLQQSVPVALCQIHTARQTRQVRSASESARWRYPARPFWTPPVVIFRLADASPLQASLSNCRQSDQRDNGQVMTDTTHGQPVTTARCVLVFGNLCKS